MSYKKIKKILCLSLIPLSISPLYFVLKNNQQIQSDNDNNLSTAFASNNKIDTKAAFDYNPIAITTNSQPVSTDTGFLGISSDSTKLYLTSYEGVIVWQTDIVNNSTIKSYYQSILNINDISKYTIKAWKYLDQTNVIAVVLSDTSSKNAILFGIKADTGLIFAPVVDSDNNPKLLSNIVTVNDGTDVLWKNSSGQIIASKYGNYSIYSNNTFVVDFSSKGVTKFDTNIIEPLVNEQSAEDMVTNYNGKTTNKTNVDGSNKYFTYQKQANWTAKNKGDTWSLLALIEGEKNSNTNFAIVIDESTSLKANNSPTNFRDGYIQQIVLVDNYLNPIKKNNQIISYTIDDAMIYYDTGVWTSSNALQKYGYLGSKTGDKQSIVWLTSAVWNAASIFEYDYSTQTFSLNKRYDLQRQSDQDVRYWSYDINTNKLFTSNSYSTSQTSIGYIDFNLDSSKLSYMKLVSPASGDYTDNNNGSYSIKKILNFSPIISKTKIKESPLIYAHPEKKDTIKGLYFPNGSATSKTIDLTRKSYSDIQSEASKSDWYKNKLASTVTKDEILTSLKFDSNPMNGTFNTEVVNLVGNDNNGTLDVKYQTTYQNWWDTSTTSNFVIETTINNMYAKKDSYFSFVTQINGNVENDEKLKLQNSYIKTIYPSQVTYSDIEKYFALPKIQDVNKNIISLTDDMVKLIADDVNGTLSIKVDYSSKLPNGLPNDYLVYQHTFSGFNNLSLFSYKLLNEQEQNTNENIINIKENYYPSELTGQMFLSNFIVLGNSYSKNFNDWEINLSPNDYLGEVIVSLKYNPKSTTIPSNLPDNLINITNDYKITGLKKITDNFRDVKTFGYSGTKTSSQIWDEYQKALLDNTDLSAINLSKLITVPYVDFKDLTITKTNLTDNKIDLIINIKENTTTSLIVNKSPFIFTKNSETYFTNSGLNYPYQVSIDINTIEQSFEFINDDGSKTDYTSNWSDNIAIDLSTTSYDFLNKNMYADQVTEDDIAKLFESTGFINIKIDIEANNQQGRLFATVSLTSTDNLTNNQNSYTRNNIPSGSVFIKRFEIYGFKIPISPVVISIPIAVVITLILIAIVIIVYLKVIYKNLNKLKNNETDKKFYINNEQLKQQKKNENYKEITNYLKKQKTKK